MGGYISGFRRKRKEQTPIREEGHRIASLISRHYRGLIGMLVPICALTWQGDKENPSNTVKCMWMWMFWSFLFQPVDVPVTGMIPIFILPMAGVVSTDIVADCYMKEGILFFILGNMLMLLLNNSGFDRRIALWFICSGDTSQFTGRRLVYKFSCAGFWLSLFSSRLITCNMLTQFATPALTGITGNKEAEPDFQRIRNVVNSAIHTSCTIGSFGFVVTSYCILTFRVIFYESALTNKAWPDIFNFYEYSCFAIPLCMVMFIANLLYHIQLIECKTISAPNLTRIRTAIMDLKKQVPKKVTFHEKLSVFFILLILAAYFTRWSSRFDGWSDFQKTEENVPQIGDTTIAAAFVVLLHCLPSGFQFLRVFRAHRQSDLQSHKPQSGILWWRFVDKNTNYGYIYVLGSGVSLMKAVRATSLDQKISEGIGTIFTDREWTLSIFLVCLVATFLPNIMSACSATVVLLPLILSLKMPEKSILREGGVTTTVASVTDEGEVAEVVEVPEHEWLQKIFIGALAAGIGTHLGFMWPFLYTPGYFCHYVGKCPKKIMAKYGFGSAVICCVILWIGVVYYSPVIWDPTTIKQVAAPITGPTTTTTTVGSEESTAGDVPSTTPKAPPP